MTTNKTPIEPRMRAVPALLSLTGIIVAALLLLRPFDERGTLLLGNLSYLLGSSLAFFFGVAATRQHGIRSPLGRLLLRLTIMFCLSTIAGAIWGYYELGLGVLSPYPSWADAVWSVAYIVGIIALSGPLRILWPRIRNSTALYVCAGWLVLVALVYVTTLHTILAAPDYTLPMKLFSLYYPVGSLIILGMGVLLFTTLRTGAFGTAWRTFLVSFITFSLADLAYTYAEWSGAYASGGWIDALYFISQLIFAYGFYKHIIALKN